MSSLPSVRHVVVGGGIVGLAIGARLAKHGSTVVLEKNAQLLSETSSRNSGVVHSGIYYPPNSLKTKLCRKGNELIWELHKRCPDLVHARQCGKWVGSVTPDEDKVLEGMMKRMDDLGIQYEILSREVIHREEPNVVMRTVLSMPHTGIIDVHSLGHYFEAVLQQHGGTIATRSKILSAEFQQDCFRIRTSDGAEMECDMLINAGGLHGEEVCKLVCDEVPADCKLHYCKGRYAACRGKPIVRRLVYPCPLPNVKGLGVHSTVDLSGKVRFGPDTTYVQDPNDVNVEDGAWLDAFHAAITKYLPSLPRDSMYADMAGMRPKLSGEGEPFRDFVIRFDGKGAARQHFVSLMGIESPGLTASMAIADYVAEMVNYPATSWT